MQPNKDERKKDEIQLIMLACWDDGWQPADIGRAFGVSRNVPIGVIHRIAEADPTALRRRLFQKARA